MLKFSVSTNINVGTICLASQSIDRKKLLEGVHFNFFTLPTDIDERRLDETPENYVLRLSKAKALAAYKVLEQKDLPSSPFLIVGGDTVVVHKGQIYGKPRDVPHAIEMLLDLQGDTHRIITGLSVLDPHNGNLISELTSSTVSIIPLSNEEVSWYVNQFQPLKFAGSYEMSNISSWLISSINGSPSNVRGLPMSRLYSIIQRLGYSWQDFVINSQQSV